MDYNGHGGMMMPHHTNGGSQAYPDVNQQAQNVLNWNPKQLDIKTKSVEKTLEPLVLQVEPKAVLSNSKNEEHSFCHF